MLIHSHTGTDLYSSVVKFTQNCFFQLAGQKIQINKVISKNIIFLSSINKIEVSLFLPQRNVSVNLTNSNFESLVELLNIFINESFYKYIF